jgi:hypothetical protein
MYSAEYCLREFLRAHDTGDPVSADAEKKARALLEDWENGPENPDGRVKFFDFGVALKYLRDGAWLKRIGWNGKDQHIKINTPEPSHGLTLPYIRIHSQQGEDVPWTASQADLLATDWCISDSTPFRLTYK